MIFHDDEDRALLLRLLARYRERFAFRLYPYWLMGNHVLLDHADRRRSPG